MSDQSLTITESPAPMSSVQIEGRAKGPPAVTVKSYSASIDDAASEAMRIYDMVCARYAAQKEDGRE